MLHTKAKLLQGNVENHERSVHVKIYYFPMEMDINP